MVQESTFQLSVNGKQHSVTADPNTPLLYILRDQLDLKGPKFGCGLSECGACTVHLGGKAVHSCVTPVSQATGAPITTLEGLGTPDNPHPLQLAFIAEQSAQCGYCINGMVMKAAAFLNETPHPTEDQIRTALAGNLCRCGTHLRIMRAISRAAEVM